MIITLTTQIQKMKTFYRLYGGKILRYGLALFLIWYFFCLPSKLFNDPTSTVILDKNQALLGAKIADD